MEKKRLIRSQNKDFQNNLIDVIGLKSNGLVRL